MTEGEGRQRSEQRGPYRFFQQNHPRHSLATRFLTRGITWIQRLTGWLRPGERGSGSVTGDGGQAPPQGPATVPVRGRAVGERHLTINGPVGQQSLLRQPLNPPQPQGKGFLSPSHLR